MPKLPKGVRSLGDVAKMRGRGGQYLKETRIKLKSTRTARSERLPKQEVKMGQKARSSGATDPIGEMKYRETMQQRKSSRDRFRISSKRAISKLGGRALGVAGGLANIGGYIRAHKSLKKRPPKTHMEGVTRVARELGFIIPKGRRPGGL